VNATFGRRRPTRGGPHRDRAGMGRRRTSTRALPGGAGPCDREDGAPAGRQPMVCSTQRRRPRRDARRRINRGSKHMGLDRWRSRAEPRGARRVSTRLGRPARLTGMTPTDASSALGVGDRARRSRAAGKTTRSQPPWDTAIHGPGRDDGGRAGGGPGPAEWVAPSARGIIAAWPATCWTARRSPASRWSGAAERCGRRLRAHGRERRSPKDAGGASGAAPSPLGGDQTNFVKGRCCAPQIGKRARMHARAVATAGQSRDLLPPARWIASDALRELERRGPRPPGLARPGGGRGRELAQRAGDIVLVVRRPAATWWRTSGARARIAIIDVAPRRARR
jgi:hypothetical protein